MAEDWETIYTASVYKAMGIPMSDVHTDMYALYWEALKLDHDHLIHTLYY